MTRFDTFPAGFSWFPHEAMTRTGHALDAGAAGVWLVDPVDDEEAMQRVLALGTPAGVVQLLDRHDRDCAAIAERLGVPHLKVPRSIPGSPFEVIRVLDVPGWHEAALWWPERRVLVVAEMIGTNAAFRLGDGDAGMHAALRVLPPRALRGYQPEHLLVGHGPGIHGPAAAAALEQAYARSRRDLPRLAVRLPKLVAAAIRNR